MSEFLEAMKAIDESSGNITKVIAGQYGKGFAVVANEVRHLASKSAAAKETVSLIEGSSNRVGEGHDIVVKTNADLEAAAKNARKSTHLIEQVTIESNEQAKSFLEITKPLNKYLSSCKRTPLQQRNLPPLRRKYRCRRSCLIKSWQDFSSMKQGSLSLQHFNNPKTPRKS